MDIRVINVPRVKILLKRQGSLALISRPVYYAEGLAQRAILKVRPAAARLYGLRRRFATVLVGLLTVWLFAHITFGANGMMVYRSKRAEVKSLQKEIDSLRTENDHYGKQIDDLKSDPKTIEKEAREHLHYARPGEVVYVIAPPPVQDTPRTDSAEK